MFIKNILCRYGAIPPTEEEYESLIKELLNLFNRREIRKGFED
jgi:hypothetical protein